jgi:hypothetical protein
MLIYGKTSIINTIQHSDTFNTDLAALIQKMEAGIESGIRPPSNPTRRLSQLAPCIRIGRGPRIGRGCSLL